MRHTLIRLRTQKPALFGNRPIPLREEDIRRDDTFTAILAQEVEPIPLVVAVVFVHHDFTRSSRIDLSFVVRPTCMSGAEGDRGNDCGTVWLGSSSPPPAHVPRLPALQATARAHRHEASGGPASLLGDGDMDVELETDKQKQRMAVDHNRVRTTKSRTLNARHTFGTTIAKVYINMDSHVDTRAEPTNNNINSLISRSSSSMCYDFFLPVVESYFTSTAWPHRSTPNRK